MFDGTVNCFEFIFLNSIRCYSDFISVTHLFNFENEIV